MLEVVSLIKDAVAYAVSKEFGYDLELNAIEVEVPQNTEFGDYSVNTAMALAKELKQSPMEIANKTVYRLLSTDTASKLKDKDVQLFSSITCAHPGFINFTLSAEWLANLLTSIVHENQAYGSFKASTPRQVALEHSNVNPNKAPHVGHLRNAVIGNFIEKIYEFVRHDVTVQYYSNDLGVQVATSYLGSLELPHILHTDFARFDYYAWDIYSDISDKLLTDKTLQAKLERIMIELEDPSSQTAQAVGVFADKILLDQLQTFSQLDIDYDVIIHERDILYTKMWDKCFELLKANPNFYLATEGKSAGCWLLKNTQEQNDESNEEYEKDKIIVRSNGIPTYTGKDIAYHMWKFGLLGRDFNYTQVATPYQSKPLFETTQAKHELTTDVTFSNADAVVDVIDQKQTYAINTVKQALSMLGYEEQSENMLHVNYGFVYISPKTAEKLGLKLVEGQKQYEMSGRKGVGIKIIDFIALVDEQLTSLYGDFPAKKDVRNGAIKFELLKYNTYSDLVFDLDAAINVKGYSGPYIQYTHARICSIQAKSASDYTSKAITLDEPALELVRLLAKFDDVVVRSASDIAPNLVCEYLFAVAKTFNAYYNDHSFLKAETPELKHFRLLLAECTKIVLRNGLALLGIVAPERV